MTQNVFFSPVLTVVFFAMVISCARDKAQEEEVADPEAEYFQDYEGPANKWGFMDTRGRVVIPPKYDQVSAFTEGVAPVNFEGKWGYISSSDSVVIPFTFRSAWQFHNGKARVIDFSGAPCILFRDGDTLCPPGITELYDYSEGLAVFQRGALHGYLDTMGQVRIEPRFDQARKFENGTARVMLRDKQGLINGNGDFVIRPEYDRVYTPSSERILVKKGNEYFYLNMQGDSLGVTYRNATPYNNNVAAVADNNGWMLVDPEGNPLTATRYAHIRPANAQRWIARQVDLLAVLDHEGNPLTPFQYSQINNFSEGYAGYCRDNLWSFMDTTGYEITPPQFGLVWDFHEGLARAAFRNGIAYVTTTGEVPFMPEYFEIRDFSEGLAPFQNE